MGLTQNAEQTNVNMQVGVITDEQLQWFTPLLLPEVTEAMEQGEPLTALGLVHEKTACGALAGYVEDGCFQIVSLYVAPDYRRQGGGKAMLAQLEKLLAENQIFSIALSFSVVDEDDKTLLPFCKALGFAEEKEDGSIYCFSLEQLQKSIQPEKLSEERPSYIKSFAELPEDVLHAAQKRGMVLETPLPEQTLNGADVERRLSHAVVKDGRVEGYAAVDHSCAGELTLCGLWVGDKNKATLNALIKAVILQAFKLYPPETRIYVQVLNEKLLRLVQTLAPDAEKISFTYRKMFD